MSAPGQTPRGRGRVASPDLAEYAAEFMPTNGKPAAPCRQCGDPVYYQLNAPPNDFWICRSCHPPSYTGWRVCKCRHAPQCDPPEHVRSAIFRWFVVPERRP